MGKFLVAIRQVVPNSYRNSLSNFKYWYILLCMSDPYSDNEQYSSSSNGPAAETYSNWGCNFAFYVCFKQCFRKTKTTWLNILKLGLRKVKKRQELMHHTYENMRTVHLYRNLLILTYLCYKYISLELNMS